MQKSNHIKFFTGLLLLVFAFSITPKRFLHNAFAKHIDVRYKKTNDNPYQVTPAGYNCDNDNLVAESAFESVQQYFNLPAFSSFPFYIFKNISFTSTPGIYSPLRGPPVNLIC